MIETKPTPERESRRISGRHFLLGVSMLLILSTSGVAVTALIFVHRMRAFGRTVSQARNGYRELNAVWPFEREEALGPVDPARMAVYEAARGALMAELTPEIDAMVIDALRREEIGWRDMLRFTAKGRGEIGRATQAHLEALWAGSMSAEEYLWIHGRVVLAVLGGNGSARTAAAYGQVLDQYEKLSRATSREDKAFDAEAYRRECLEAFGSAAPIEVGAVAGFDAPLTTGRLLDLLTASPGALVALLGDLGAA